VIFNDLRYALCDLLFYMVISYYGEGCLKLQSGDQVILIDPVESTSGLTAPRFKYDAVLRTLTPFPAPFEYNKEAAPEVLGAGEYDFNDVNVKGFFVAEESSEKFLKTVYWLEMEGINFCFLGHISQALSPETMEGLNGIDILVVPAGGEPFLDQKIAVKLIKQIQPKIAIPTFYKVPGLKRKADDVKKFLEEIEASKVEKSDKLVIKKKDIEDIKPTKVVVLTI